MSYSVQDFTQALEKLAPQALALDWDNVGLQIGDFRKKVAKVLVTLTVTKEVVDLAVSEGVDLIIAHHPLIFKPLKRIRTDQPEGQVLSTILKHDIAVYVAHTNLDRAPNGLNAWLAEDLGLREPKVLVPDLDPEIGLGRVGEVDSLSLATLKQQLEELWQSPVRLVGDPAKRVEKVAVLGGSGGSFLNQAAHKGADVLITGDVSYHDALDAKALGLAVIDAGHFSTEQIMVTRIAQFLRQELKEPFIMIEETSANPFRF